MTLHQRQEVIGLACSALKAFHASGQTTFQCQHATLSGAPRRAQHQRSERHAIDTPPPREKGEAAEFNRRKMGRASEPEKRRKLNHPGAIWTHWRLNQPADGKHHCLQVASNGGGKCNNGSARPHLLSARCNPVRGRMLSGPMAPTICSRLASSVMSIGPLG